MVLFSSSSGVCSSIGSSAGSGVNVEISSSPPGSSIVGSAVGSSIGVGSGVIDRVGGGGRLAVASSLLAVPGHPGTGGLRLGGGAGDATPGGSAAEPMFLPGGVVFLSP